MNDFGDLIEKFFINNQSEILKNYPGLKLSFLKESYESFLKNKIDKPDVFFKSIQKGIPLQYIIKKSFFYNTELYVDQRVLIPRFETELLVELMAKYYGKYFCYKKSFSVIDIGTGSGAIPIAFLKEVANSVSKPTNVYFSDISQEALEVAQINYNNLLENDQYINMLINKKQLIVKFLQMDRLTNVFQKQKFDLIVSNPPYIKEKNDLSGVHQQVQLFEPKLALYLKDDIYEEWFATFFKEVYHCLDDHGFFIMEGHENNLAKLLFIAKEEKFLEVEIKNDLNNLPRFLIAKK